MIFKKILIGITILILGVLGGIALPAIIRAICRRKK